MIRRLSARTSDPYDNVMSNVTLPPELERFATEAVAAGRYRDVADVLAAGVRLLQQAEAEVAAFVASLEEAQAEGAREGFFAADDVHREMSTMLDEMARAKT